MDVPEGSTELQLPPMPAADGVGIYQQSGDRTPDGLEIWDMLEMWSSSGLVPL